MFLGMCNNVILSTWCVAGHGDQMIAPGGGNMSGAGGAALHIRGENVVSKI
jgi:hypothetical protein